MDLSLIQKDILVTLITLYHRHSQPVKGEDIAEVIHRNPGTIRNQMQALKTLELVDGVPGPKGGYNPTMKAYQELNISQSGQDVQVPIARNGVLLPELSATEVDLTTLCHPDVCHAVVRIMGSVRQFQNGDEITVGPTPVNKLLIRGEIFGKDERNGALMISISEMISLPKKPVRAYMSHPLHVVPATATLEDAVRLFAEEQINGAPVMDGTTMQGIVTVTDVVRALAAGRDLSTRVTEVMTGDVVQVDGDVRLYEVV
ncbi:MAG TPA: CBS domain-containing protein, partial [Methanoregulaceae archaeon]|nr:CBS domain-containing protein [Methanoregulaceae archaeon]